MASKAIEKAATGEIVLSANAIAVREQFQTMAMTLPPLDDDGALGIVAQIMNASSVEDLDSAWDTVEAEELLGVKQIITNARYAMSDYEDGLGIFLVIDAINVATGEAFIWTTGSVSVVAQIVKAHHAGWFPLACILQQAKKPTKDGNFPQHLAIYRVEK